MQHYTTQQLATLLGVSGRTVQNWRASGKGPPYTRPSAGVCFYSVADVDAWLAAGRRRVTPACEKREAAGT